MIVIHNRHLSFGVGFSGDVVGASQVRDRGLSMGGILLIGAIHKRCLFTNIHGVFKSDFITNAMLLFFQQDGSNCLSACIVALCLQEAFEDRVIRKGTTLNCDHI